MRFSRPRAQHLRPPQAPLNSSQDSHKAARRRIDGVHPRRRAGSDGVQGPGRAELRLPGCRRRRGRHRAPPARRPRPPPARGSWPALGSLGTSVATRASTFTSVTSVGRPCLTVVRWTRSRASRLVSYSGLLNRDGDISSLTMPCPRPPVAGRARRGPGAACRRPGFGGRTGAVSARFVGRLDHVALTMPGRGCVAHAAPQGSRARRRPTSASGHRAPGPPRRWRRVLAESATAVPRCSCAAPFVAPRQPTVFL